MKWLNNMFRLLIFLFPVFAWAQAEVGIRVIDESAIPYMEFLSKAEFDQRFPGQIKSDPAELDSGWYVIYAHENLNYHFGPILLKSIGQDYQAQLATMVEAAVEQRPEIAGYQLVLSYEPSTVSSETGRSSSDGLDDRSSSTNVGNEPKPDETSKPTGFWGFVRKIFGM